MASRADVVCRYAEAEKYQVLPLDGDVMYRMSVAKPSGATARDEFVPSPGGASVLKIQKLHFLYNSLSREQSWLKSPDPRPDGDLALRVRYSVPRMFHTQGLSCGYDGKEHAAHEEYTGTFPCTGTRRVTVDLSGDLKPDTEAELRMAMMRQ